MQKAPAHEDRQEDIDEVLQREDPGTAEGKGYERRQEDADGDENRRHCHFLEFSIIHDVLQPFHIFVR